MDIIVSSPGSPGTSFTQNVKDQIVSIFDELEENEDFSSLPDFKSHLESIGLNANYTRNILPFLQYCGIIKYEGISKFENKKIFTNIGRVYVDILKSIKIAELELDSQEKDDILISLETIQEIIYFQCLVLMMKSKECNYAEDFYEVLCFIKKYGSIDSTEYLLIQYTREQEGRDFLEKISGSVYGYRDGSIQINIKTNTKTDSAGEARSVNSFPYVSGNFLKAGIFVKNKNRFYFKEDRLLEIECALSEVQNNARI